MIKRVELGVLSLLLLTTSILPAFALAEQSVKLQYTQTELEEKWRDRIHSILDKGTIPLIDFLSFLPRDNSAQVIRWTKEVMDQEGVALMSFAGYWAPKDSGCKGHCWDYSIHRIVNADPDRFILTTNKGGNKNWWKQKSGRSRDYIEQLDTVIWIDDGHGSQAKRLKKDYKDLLTKFSDRFVVGFDYGLSNRQSADYLKQRIENIRLILRDLPDDAKHKIGYKNAWFLLTQKVWG